MLPLYLFTNEKNTDVSPFIYDKLLFFASNNDVRLRAYLKKSFNIEQINCYCYEKEILRIRQDPMSKAENSEPSVYVIIIPAIVYVQRPCIKRLERLWTIPHLMHF